MSKRRDPTGADASQTHRESVSRGISDLAKQTLETEDVLRRSSEGAVKLQGEVKEALENLSRRKGQRLKMRDIVPPKAEVSFPWERNRLVAEVYGELVKAGGFESLEAGELSNKNRLEKLGLLQLKDKRYSTTPLLDEKIPKVIDHEGGKYSWISTRKPEDQDTIFETVVTGKRDGRRVDALHFMDRKTTAPKALEAKTGIDARSFLYELERIGCVDFSREGVETTERGGKLVDLLDETYEALTSTARDRAEGYIELADKRSEYEDNPLLGANALNISGHRELTGRYIRKIRGTVPEELQAFEDYI